MSGAHASDEVAGPPACARCRQSFQHDQPVMIGRDGEGRRIYLHKLGCDTSNMRTEQPSAVEQPLRQAPAPSPASVGNQDVTWDPTWTGKSSRRGEVYHPPVDRALHQKVSSILNEVEPYN